MFTRKTIFFALVVGLIVSGGVLHGQMSVVGKPMGPFNPGPGRPVAIEFISPVITEFVPNQPFDPITDCWEIIIEASINQSYFISKIGVLESFNLPAPGMMGPLPTDTILERTRYFVCVLAGVGVFLGFYRHSFRPILG